MPRRRQRRVDPYPGPDAVWLFLLRNRRGLVIVAFAILIMGAFWVIIEYSRGCPGTEAQHTLVATLEQDPFLTASLPEEASTIESTAYLSCRNANRIFSRGGAQQRNLDITLELIKRYSLAHEMNLVEVHDHQLASVGSSRWRLTHTDARSLTYCRVLGGYRVVTVMALADRQLTTQTLAWTDGADCGPEIAITR